MLYLDVLFIYDFIYKLMWSQLLFTCQLSVLVFLDWFILTYVFVFLITLACFFSIAIYITIYAYLIESILLGVFFLITGLKSILICWQKVVLIDVSFWL